MLERRWVNAAAAVALLVSACVSVWGQVAAGQPAAPAAVPRIEVNTTEWKFGEVWQGEPAQGEIVIKNVGTAPLTLDVKSDCGCTVPSKPRSPLAPGEHDTLTISYDTLKRKGPALQTVTIVTNDDTQPRVAIKVQGHVKPLFTFEPTNVEGIFFYDMRSDAQVTQSVKLHVAYDRPLHFRLKTPHDFGHFDVSLKELEPGKAYELSATTKPPLAEQTARAEVVLLTGLEHVPELTVPLYAYVSPDVLVTPVTIRVARQSTVSKPATVTFKCRADKPVQIKEIRPSHPGITYEIATPPEAQKPNWITRTIQLSIPPGQELPPGNSKIEILTDSADPRFQKFDIHVVLIEARIPPPPGAAAGPTTQPGPRGGPPAAPPSAPSPQEPQRP